MKRRSAGYVAVYALFLAAVLFLTATDRNQVSGLENRTLSAFPRFSFGAFLSGDFQNQLEDALGDHIPFSEKIRGAVRSAGADVLRLEQEAVYGSFPELKNNYTQIAEGYYSYAGDAHRIVEKPVPFAELPEGLRAFAAKTESLSGVRRFVYWIDNSRSVSFDHPEISEGQEEVFSLFPGSARETFSFEGYGEFSDYFYQTDHHWNYRGSYRGYTEILAMLRPEETPVPIAEEITISAVFNGSYARQTNLLCADEPFRFYRFDLPKSAVTMNGKRGIYGRMDAYIKGRYTEEPLTNHYSVCYGGEYGEIVYDSGTSGRDVLLLIASSYSNPINGLLASHFDRTYVIDPRYYAQWAGEAFDPESYAPEHGVTDLLLMGDTEFFLKDLSGEAEGGDA